MQRVNAALELHARSVTPSDISLDVSKTCHLVVSLPLLAAVDVQCGSADMPWLLLQLPSLDS